MARTYNPSLLEKVEVQKAIAGELPWDEIVGGQIKEQRHISIPRWVSLYLWANNKTVTSTLLLGIGEWQSIGRGKSRDEIEKKLAFFINKYNEAMSEIDRLKTNSPQGQNKKE